MRNNILWLFFLNYQNNQDSQNENTHSGWGFIEHVIHFETKSVIHEPTALASPGSLLEFQNFRPHPRPEWSRICIVIRPLGDSYAH